MTRHSIKLAMTALPYGHVWMTFCHKHSTLLRYCECRARRREYHVVCAWRELAYCANVAEIFVNYDQAV